MSAEELRQAAETLRERSGLAFEPPWVADEGNVLAGPFDVCDAENAADAHYIATMHPGVGLAPAQWLNNVAHNWDAQSGGLKADALDVARLVNGGAS